MKKGDIVLATFPFTDFSGDKLRPALVLTAGDRDVCVAFISTQFKWKEATDIVLNANTKTGLKKESLIRLSKLATLDQDLVIGRLGEIDNKTSETVNKNLKIIFQLN